MNVYALSLGFNKPEIIEESLKQYRATQSGLVDFRHILIDQHYPLPNKAQNKIELQRIACKTGCELFDPGCNLGLHEGLNWACKQLSLKDDDIIIGYDVDSWPTDSGWDMALVTALANGGDVWWASLMNSVSRGELEERGFTRRNINQLSVLEAHAPCVNSVCAWRWEFIRKAGGFKEPSAFYGGLECAMWHELQKFGKKWVYIDGYWETNHFYGQVDQHYRDYKWAHAHEGLWPGDFESYLKHRGII